MSLNCFPIERVYFTQEVFPALAQQGSLPPDWLPASVSDILPSRLRTLISFYYYGT